MSTNVRRVAKRPQRGGVKKHKRHGASYFRKTYGGLTYGQFQKRMKDQELSHKEIGLAWRKWKKANPSGSKPPVPTKPSAKIPKEVRKGVLELTRRLNEVQQLAQTLKDEIDRIDRGAA